MPGLSGRVPVLAIRKGDERFASLKGIRMEDIEKVSKSSELYNHQFLIHLISGVVRGKLQSWELY